MWALRGLYIYIQNWKTFCCCCCLDIYLFRKGREREAVEGEGEREREERETFYLLGYFPNTTVIQAPEPAFPRNISKQVDLKQNSWASNPPPPAGCHSCKDQLNQLWHNTALGKHLSLRESSSIYLKGRTMLHLSDDKTLWWIHRSADMTETEQSGPSMLRLKSKAGRSLPCKANK